MQTKLKKTLGYQKQLVFGIKKYIKNLENSGFSVKREIYKIICVSFPLVLTAMVLLGCVLSIKKRIKKYC